MDNLTHSMLGAVIGQTGLKRKSGLGMAALIIGANLPDIDATCTIFGTQSLAMRRGLTHGPIALVLLPILLTGLLILYDRWQDTRGTRPHMRLPVRPGWLLALAYLGTLSHPTLDWLNSYGIRLLEPFSHRWFYGDALFIIDLTLWTLLIGGFFWSWRAEKRSSGDWQRRGMIVTAAAGIYILVNGAITGVAEARAESWVRHVARREPAMVVANPVPLTFWRREMLWRSRDGHYGSYAFDILAPAEPANAPGERRTGMDDPHVARQAGTSRNAEAFLFWSRMPIARFEPDGSLVLTDQRFAGGPARGSFVVTVPPEKKP